MAHHSARSLNATFDPGEHEMNEDNSLIPAANWQTPVRGTNDQEYQVYLACADNGKGGDITRNGAPLKTYDEWLAS